MLKNKKVIVLFLLVVLLWGGAWPDKAQAASQIRITEIMYDPSGDGSREFIEFYNGSDSVASLGGWSTVGVDFVFGAGTTLAPKAHIVIVRNLPAFRAAYPGVPIAGQYGGKLRGSGETVALYNSSAQVVSQVTYAFGGAWPSTPRNGGPSLSLVRPTANAAQPACWGASSTNGGSPGFVNSVAAGYGAGCGDVAYPSTPERTSSPVQQGETSTPQQASPQEEKEKTEQKKQEEIKKKLEAEQAKKVSAAVEKQRIEDAVAKEQRNRARNIIVLSVLTALIAGVAGGLVLRRYLIKKQVKTVLNKGGAKRGKS